MEKPEPDGHAIILKTSASQLDQAGVGEKEGGRGGACRGGDVGQPGQCTEPRALSMQQ